jgi:hypothetical protein
MMLFWLREITLKMKPSEFRPNFKYLNHLLNVGRASGPRSESGRGITGAFWNTKLAGPVDGIGSG